MKYTLVLYIVHTLAMYTARVRLRHKASIRVQNNMIGVLKYQ